MDLLEKVVNPKKLAKNPSCKDLWDIDVSEDKKIWGTLKRDPFFCNQEADEQPMRRNLDILDEANCKRSEADEMREVV